MIKTIGKVVKNPLGTHFIALNEAPNLADIETFLTLAEGKEIDVAIGIKGDLQLAFAEHVKLTHEEPKPWAAPAEPVKEIELKKEPKAKPRGGGKK